MILPLVLSIGMVANGYNGQLIDSNTYICNSYEKLSEVSIGGVDFGVYDSLVRNNGLYYAVPLLSNEFVSNVFLLYDPSNSGITTIQFDESNGCFYVLQGDLTNFVITNRTKVSDLFYVGSYEFFYIDNDDYVASFNFVYLACPLDLMSDVYLLAPSVLGDGFNLPTFDLNKVNVNLSVYGAFDNSRISWSSSLNSRNNGIVETIASPLSLTKDLATNFLDGFTKLFYDNNQLTNLAWFSLVFLGIAIVFGMVNLSMSLIGKNTGVK